MPFNLHILVDNGTVKSRKLVDLRKSDQLTFKIRHYWECTPFQVMTMCLVCFAKASNFARNTFKKTKRFLKRFRSLETEMHLNDDLCGLQKFVRAIFGEK